MASSRPAQNIFWSFITSLVDGEKVNKVRLYDEAIHRLQDSTFFVLGKVAEALQLLQSVDVGTAASITGSVNLTTFDFAAGATLSGLTLSIDEDTALPQVVTFPNTITSIPLLLNELATQAATNLEFEITDAGLLVARSGTLGAGSTMATITGTAALALFGAQTSVAGSGLVNDGASRVGVGVLSGFPGGTLRSLLEVLVSSAELAGITVQDWRTTDAGQTISDTTQEILVVQNAAAPRVYTFPTPATDGRIITLRRANGATSAVNGAGPLSETVTFPSGGVDRSYRLVSLGGTWFVTSVGT